MTDDSDNRDFSEYWDVDIHYSDHWDDDLWVRDDDPYNAELWSDPELPRFLLYRSGLGGQPCDYDLPELASAWLAELANIGLLEPDPGSEAPFKQPYSHRPMEDPHEGEMYPVRLGDHRYTLWLCTDGPRTYGGNRSGYKSIKVHDKPLKTQTAIVALLTVLEGQFVHVERLRKTPSQGPVPFGVGYVRSLLRHYRSDFDYLPHEDKLNLMDEASKRVSSFLNASRQLMEFLEYGVPGHDVRPPIEDANRDVKAAVFKDVEGLTFIKVAERFDLTITDKERDKGDHARARWMVKRGREVLEGALGKEGWQRQIEAMKADAEEFRKHKAT